MTDRYAKISFIANGHIVQDVLITAPHISAQRLNEMLSNGEAVTTIQEGQGVCVTTGDWLPIGVVTYVEAELDYEEFQLEDEYTLPTPQTKTFNASRMALAGAIGDYIKPADRTCAETLEILKQAGGSEPPLRVVHQYSGMSGDQLLEKIKLTEIGFKSLMEVAYGAAKRGEELI